MGIRIDAKKAGEVLRFRLPDRSKYFLESLPWFLRLRQAGLIGGKGESLWEFYFPFFVRTALGPWNISIEIMELVEAGIGDCQTSEELLKRLKGPVSHRLNDWVWANNRRARAESVEKLEDFGEDKYRQRRMLITRMLREHAQNVAGEALGHAVEIFPSAADAIENDDQDRLAKVVSSLSDEELKDAAGLTIQMMQSLQAQVKNPELYKFEALFIMDTIGIEMSRRTGKPFE